MSKSLSPHKVFTGNIDALLAHCTQLDFDRVEKLIDKDDNEVLTPGEAVTYIMELSRCTKEQAEKIRFELAMEQILETYKGLEAKGMAELTGYDDEGLPVYQMTAKGKQALGMK